MRIVSRNFQDRPTLPPRALRRVVDATAARLRLAGDSVAFVYIGDDEMTRFHRDFMGIDDTTDVMSFPAGEEAEAEEAHLGDVLICTDAAARQACELAHPYPTELTVLAIHGLLHLAGYDHVDDGAEMRALEEALRPRAAPPLSGDR